MFNKLHKEGIEAFSKAEYEKAIVSLEQYIAQQDSTKKDPNVSYALDVLGQCFEQMDKDDKAMTSYKAAITINPNAASAWHNMGLLHLKLAEPFLKKDLSAYFAGLLEAKVFLKKALGIWGSHPNFLNSMASWFEEYAKALRNISLAEKVEQEALQKNIESHFKLAIHNYQKALTACHEDDLASKRVISINLTKCFTQYGNYLYQSEDFSKALTPYFQAYLLDRNDLTVLNQIGKCYSHLGNQSAARMYFEDILEKTSVREILAEAWLNITCTYMLQKLWYKAEITLKKAKLYAPCDPDVLEIEKELLAARPKSYRGFLAMLNSQATTTASQPQEPASEIGYK